MNIVDVIKFLFPNAKNLIDFIVNGDGSVTNWNPALGEMPTDAQILAATPSAQVAYDKAQANAPILAQIVNLEATVTQRRVREHLNGVNTAFVPGVDAQVAALRAQLK